MNIYTSTASTLKISLNAQLNKEKTTKLKNSLSVNVGMTTPCRCMYCSEGCTIMAPFWKMFLASLHVRLRLSGAIDAVV